MSDPAPPDASPPEFAVIRAVYDAFARADVDAGLALMTDDVHLDLEETARLAGRHAPYLGHDGAREYFADVARIWDELTLAPATFEVSERGVLVRGSARGRIGTQVIQARVSWMWSVRDGLVERIEARGLDEVRTEQLP